MTEDIFNKATLKYGGIFPHHNIFKHNFGQINTLLNKYQNAPSLLKPFPMVITNFVNNEKFNAFAMKYDNYYIIGIHATVHFILYDLFNRMLSHKEILTQIGDPTNEIISNNSLTDYHLNLRSLFNNKTEKNTTPFQIPVDNIRKEYAEYLAILATHFIFEHELSHILYGHIDYINAEYGFSHLFEFDSISNEQQDKLDLQTLEMDADCTALGRCCHLILATFNKPSKDSINLKKFFNTPYEALSGLHFATYNTIRLFGDRDYKDLKVGKSSHPDPRIRELMLTMTIDAYVASFTNLDKEKVMKIINETSLESEKAHTKLTGKKPDLDVFKPEFYAEHPLPKDVENNWKNNIREKLKPHTFIPLIPCLVLK